MITPDKETSKHRIVLDASAKTKKISLSLNEYLHQGPMKLEDLCALLMTFCTKEIEIFDDIEKTFLQIALQLKERDVTRSLWLKDINKEPTSDNIITY